MKIQHKIDEFLYELFPIKTAGNDIEALKSEIQKFYSVGPFKPKIHVKDDLIEIEIEGKLISKHRNKFQDIIKLCEAGKLDQARKQIVLLIKEAPQVSEYYRILGQIQSDHGQQDSAIDTLIDALRWDPQNEWALIMMGNIFARDKDDIETAMKYYEQAAKNNPEDNIAINNIGANLMQLGKNEEAKSYFKKALELNPDYPNTYYAMGMLANNQNDTAGAFTNSLTALNKNPRRDGLFNNSMQLAIESAKKLADPDNGLAIVQAYMTKLEMESGKSIKIQADSSIPTAAKIEFAENYDREEHIVLYKPEYPAVHHLVMHELVHLDFVVQARQQGNNQLFVSTNNHKSKFIKSLERDAKKLNKKGYSAQVLANFFTGLFDGLNRQVYNTPIDLFIEDKLYAQYPELQPYQFLSLFALTQEGIQAVTDKKVVALSPQWVLSKSKIFNIVNTLHFKTLFGIDLTKELDPTRIEQETAVSLYEEFKEYRNDKEPGEEYDLVIHWAEDLKLDKYFNLVDEKSYRTSKTPEQILESIEKDPLDQLSTDPSRKEDMDAFMRSHSNKDLNMAVAMFMVDALQYFNNLEQAQIKEIAFEIATIGTQGIRPDSKNHSVPSIKGKTFSGYHLLAYYYVSWALAIPEMLDQLQLPFNKEYEVAQQFKSQADE